MSRYENPALTVDAVWVSRGRILLVRRSRAPFPGQWALPGGFVELRETVEAALSRELQEETGLSGQAGPLVGVYSGPERDPRKPTTSVAFLVRGPPRTPRPGDDAAEAAWIPLREVEPLAFDHDRIVDDAVRILKRISPRSLRSRPLRSRASGPSRRPRGRTSSRTGRSGRPRN